MKVYGVVGWKNSGKTGLVERLVAEFVARGVMVSTIKHAHHAFDVDQPGKDSHRHRTAGATEVLVSSRHRWALMHELRDDHEPSLDVHLSRLAPVDLVLVEGFKTGTHRKVEAHRAETSQGLLAPGDPMIRAVAADGEVEVDVPVLSLDDTAAIADFIAAELGL